MSLEKKMDTIKKLVDTKMNGEKKIVELYVAELGWLILLLDALEFVQDSWYNSTRYNPSSIQYCEDHLAICMHHVYRKNEAYDAHQNNQIYNLIFDELNVFIDKIIAFR